MTPLLGRSTGDLQESSDRGLYNGTYGAKNFQPRIGFAWTPSRAGWQDGISRRLQLSPPIWKARAPTCASPSTYRSPKAEPWCSATTFAVPTMSTESWVWLRSPASNPFAGAPSGSGTRTCSRHRPAMEWYGAAPVRQPTPSRSAMSASTGLIDGSHALPAEAVPAEQR